MKGVKLDRVEPENPNIQTDYPKFFRCVILECFSGVIMVNVGVNDQVIVRSR